MLEEEAKARQVEAGKERAATAERNDAGQLVQRIEQASDEPAVREKPSIEIAAAAAGTNKTYVANMKVIAAKAPEKVADIDAGKLTVPAAMRELKQSGVIPVKPGKAGFVLRGM